MFDKVENNKKITQAKKDRILSILEWLQDAINKKLKILNTLEEKDELTKLLNEVD
jgi:hypothetical protein